MDNWKELIPFYHAYHSPEFSYGAAGFWSLISAVRWVFGGMAGGVMATVLIANPPQGVLIKWGVGLLIGTFIIELLLRASAAEEELPA